MGKQVSSDPIYQANADYRAGEGQCANPYTPNTTDHYMYSMEMHRLQCLELREIRRAIA